jgi:hypothetical protein
MMLKYPSCNTLPPAPPRPMSTGSIMDVDGGGLPGYDHCYCRLAPGEPYAGPSDEVEIAR